MTTPVPPEAIAAAAATLHDWIADGNITAFDLPQYANQAAVHALTAAADMLRAEGAAAERDRCIGLITGKRDEFADHARQARALPKTAETLALKADVLDEALDLLRGEP